MPDEYRWIASAKGEVIRDGAVLLLENDRGDWELPGGRLDPDDESVEAAVAREILEETGLVAAIGTVCHTEIFRQIGDGTQVLIVAYAASVDSVEVQISDEHVGAAWVGLDVLDEIDLPDVYRRAIAAFG
ncbi:MAG: NUDIX domain-containing protein [Actinomycetota bacterium]